MIGQIIGLIGIMVMFYVNAETTVDAPRGKQSLPHLIFLFCRSSMLPKRVIVYVYST